MNKIQNGTEACARPLGPQKKRGNRKGCLLTILLASDTALRWHSVQPSLREALAEQSARGSLVQAQTRSRLIFEDSNLGPTGYTPFGASMHACLVLRTMLGCAKPPRSNRRAARLCKHRLARA